MFDPLSAFSKWQWGESAHGVEGMDRAATRRRPASKAPLNFASTDVLGPDEEHWFLLEYG